MMDFNSTLCYKLPSIMPSITRVVATLRKERENGRKVRSETKRFDRKVEENKNFNPVQSSYLGAWRCQGPQSPR